MAAITVPVSAAAAGPTRLVRSEAGRRVLVLGYSLRAAGDVAVKFQGGERDLTGAEPLTGGGGAVLAGRAAGAEPERLRV